MPPAILLVRSTKTSDDTGRGFMTNEKKNGSSEHIKMILEEGGERLTMDEYTVAEQAYRNGKELGYLEGYEDGRRDAARDILVRLRNVVSGTIIPYKTWELIKELYKKHGIDCGDNNDEPSNR